MQPYVPSRRRARLATRLRRRARAVLPLLCWCLACAGVLLLLQYRQPAGAVRGIVEVAEVELRCPVDGRLQSLDVALHQPVQQGRLLGRLDDADLRLRLQGARAGVEQLRAELQRRQAELEHDAAVAASEAGFEHAVELRRLADSAEAADIDRLATRAELEEARVRLRGTSIELERLQRLGDLVAEPELVRVTTEQEALQQRIAELEALQLAQRQRCDAVAQRQQQFAAPAALALAPAAQLEPLRWQLRAQEAELERLALHGRQLDLLAPAAGVVAALRHQAGEWLAVGDALLTVVEPVPRRIRVYVPPALLDRYAQRAQLTVTTDSRPRAPQRAPVLSVSPAPVPVPEPLWRLPRQQEWAFELLLAASGSELPGERVQVQPPRGE